MKYWIITTEYPPMHGGGIGTYCYHTAQMFLQKGHKVKIFIPDHSITNNIQADISEGIDVVRFKPEGKDYYNYLGYHSALSYHFYDIIEETIAKEGAPDFIESQEYTGIAYYLLLKKKTGSPSLKSIPIIITAHAPAFFYWENNQYPLYKLPDFWIGEMERWVLKAADILISPSQYLMDNIKEIVDAGTAKYEVLRNPYKITQNYPTPKYTQGDIVFFGKLAYQKGCLQLVAQMAKLWDEKFPYPLSIIGGDMLFELRQMTMKEYIIKKYKRYYEKGLIKFEGKLTLPEIEKRLAKAHAVIVPSIVDNFPYTVLEGMSMKKIMLVSDGGGQREMIEDGISGFIYKKDDPNSFKNKLLAIMSLSRDQVNEIGEIANARMFEMCNYDTIYKAKLKVLNSYKAPELATFPYIHDIEKTPYTKDENCISGLLSIVVPYYNTGKYIEETIKSIFKVNYSPKEVIVIDDGSDDVDSIEILSKLESKYDIKVIRQKNSGLPGARNTGVTNAKGEFIAYLDADDLIDPDFYSRAINLLGQYKNVSFVTSWVKYFDASNGIWPSQIPEPPFMLLHNMINAGFVSRRKDYINFGTNDNIFEYGMEDYDCNISMLENGCRGIVIPEPLYYYRIHASSMARQFNVSNQLYLYKILSRKHSKIYAEYATDIFNLLVANGPSYLYDNPTFEPATDVKKLKDWILELEKSNQWYSNTLKSFEEKLSLHQNTISETRNELVKELQSDIRKSKDLTGIDVNVDFIDQQARIAQLTKDLNWYKNTYENRKLLGILKDKVVKVLKPKKH